MSLNLDIDRVRSMTGRWRDEPETAGLLAAPSPSPQRERT
jgi:hypothetical protein